MPTWSGITPPTPWHGAGTRVPTVDGRIFVRTEGALDRGPVILLLHGFPTSSWDYAAVMRRLAASSGLPVLAIDLLGFGLSDKPPTFRYRAYEQTDVVLSALGRLGVEEAHVVAHDGATAIAAELLARRERDLLRLAVRSVVFVAGTPLRAARSSALAEWMTPVGERQRAFAKPAGFGAFRREMRRLLAYPDTVSDDEWRVSWDLLTREHGLARWDRLVAARDEGEESDDRWSKALGRADVPALVMFCDRDPIAPVRSGERLAAALAQGRLRVLRDVGHYPHIETPDVFAAEVMAFVASVRPAR